MRRSARGIPTVRRQLDRPSPRGGAVEAEMQAHGLHDLIAHGVDRTERAHRLLKDQSDLAPADSPHLVAARIELREIVGAAVVAGPAKMDRSAHDPTGALDDSQDRARRHALAAAALPDDAQRLPGVHVEARAVDGLDHALVREKVGPQITDRQDRQRPRRIGRPRRAPALPGRVRALGGLGGHVGAPHVVSSHTDRPRRGGRRP